jgi:hypothetical protein
MNYMERIAGFTTLWVLSMCSAYPSDSHSAPSHPRVQLKIIDEPTERRFVLTLRSLEHKPVCLRYYQWPNSLGQVDDGPRRATLRSREGTYPARDHNFGYSVGAGGTLRILPGSTLTGFVAYSEFGNPALVQKLTHRELHFNVIPHFCDG